jgi:hypothetical protein
VQEYLNTYKSCCLSNVGLSFSFVVYGCSLGIAVWIAIVAHIFAYAPHLAGRFWLGIGTLNIIMAAP